MDLQGKKQIPSLGLVLVIDRSGSMSDGKLELAKEAAMRTVELLRDVDTVGVVAFDSAPWWVVEPTKLTKRDEVLKKIQSIQPQGGTEIYTALEAGYQGLLNLEAQRKHMILLTDGQSATNLSYDIITDAMNENMMTLSTVAVGEGSDVMLLESLAKAAKGRFYFTKDQSTLPAIFSRETVLMSRTYIVDGTITPSIGDGADWRSLWKDGAPNLQAYIATTPKEMAEVALWSPDGDPLLARWTYGSGRSIAWTSDLTGKWSPDWVKWGSFPKIFAEWVKWTFPEFDRSPYSIKAEVEGGDGKLIVESTGEDYATGNGAGLWAGLQNEDSLSPLKRLMPVAPGRYEAQLDVVKPGAYLAQIGMPNDANNATSINGGTTAGFVIPYSPEYRIGDEEGPELLKGLASSTNGRELGWEDAGKSYSFEPLKNRVPFDWTRELLVIVLLLWLLDIALRRLSLPWHRISTVITAPFSRLQRSQTGIAPPNIESTTALTRMKKRAEERNRFYGNDSSNEQRDKSQMGTPPSVATIPPSGKFKERDLLSTSSNVNNSADQRLSANDVQSKPEVQSSTPTDRTVSRLLAAKNKNNKL
nr:VWA domain-containing protein [Paenibacillus sp. GSMTC-2017]